MYQKGRGKFPYCHKCFFFFGSPRISCHVDHHLWTQTRCHVLQSWSLIGSFYIFSRMLSRIHRTPSREEAITFDELQRVKNIKHVWSMQLLLHAMEIASQSSAHGAIKGAIWCNFDCMRRKLPAIAKVCGGLKNILEAEWRRKTFFGYWSNSWNYWLLSRLTFVSATSPIVLYTYNFVSKGCTFRIIQRCLS